MQTWQLPEHIADILPATARQVESAKESLLKLFRVYGYELVNPPLLEYSESLMADRDPGLSLKTIRVVDQLSGLQLGLRADITPQVARIDAHLLAANEGINRLCYAGSVLHARPDSLMSTREPLQVGAELYGCASVDADIELIDLMLRALRQNNVAEVFLSLGHIGVFRALASEAALSNETADGLLQIMQTKDKQRVAEFVANLSLRPELQAAFMLLPSLYGDVSTVARAKAALPALPLITAALAEVEAVCQAYAAETIHVDFADVRVDTYHTGLLFAAYAPGWSDAVARGGRYDHLGAQFGRARPATGFSLDLRDLIKVLPQNKIRWGIKVAADKRTHAQAHIEQLRTTGETVVVDYLGQSAKSLNCNRELVLQDGQWQVVPCI
ncbi:MAG: ATP phosphoribosyltransferase regulatory subunit [Neisseriaceae bacterium]|nr:ATP phosphoribosyltransferase regulatory subunit [Neisseriaceae bacterium]MBP6861543.1 ATP phosphoribosyltransferase regulatory subunit [Neisseriaceae bacterium]